MFGCVSSAHPLRGSGPNLVLSGALFPCQTAATDTSVSPDWILHADRLSDTCIHIYVQVIYVFLDAFFHTHTHTHIQILSASC